MSALQHIPLADYDLALHTLPTAAERVWVGDMTVFTETFKIKRADASNYKSASGVVLENADPDEPVMVAASSLEGVARIWVFVEDNAE